MRSAEMTAVKIISPCTPDHIVVNRRLPARARRHVAVLLPIRRSRWGVVTMSARPVPKTMIVSSERFGGDGHDRPNRILHFYEHLRHDHSRTVW